MDSATTNNRCRVVIRSDNAIQVGGPSAARTNFIQPVNLRDILSLDGIEFVNVECTYISPITTSGSTSGLLVSVRELQGNNTYDTIKKGPSTIVGALDSVDVNNLFFKFNKSIGVTKLSREVLNSHMWEILVENSDSVSGTLPTIVFNWMMVLEFWW